MGINIHVYTVYGFEIPWNDAFNEAYEEYLVKNMYTENKLALIDYMSGEYMILGPILYDSGDFRYMVEMNDYQEIDVDRLHQLKNSYYLKFEKAFPELIHLLGEGAGWKLINVIHYT
jgi:hypothetical protein